MLQKLRKFTGHENFTRAVILTVAAVIPVTVLSLAGLSELGFSVALGALLLYPADIPSNIDHRIRGLTIAALIVAGSTLIVNILHPYKILFYPVVTFMVFFLSMLSVYGQRATMVAFSGLIAIALGTGHLHSGYEILATVGLMFCGSLFYILLSVTFNLLNPYRYTELQIAECLRLTSGYLKLRGDLWDGGADRESIIKKQLDLQVEINTTHENLREILIRNRSNAGSSNRNRKMLLVFISLVEILELALSTSFDHDTLHQKFGNHSKLLNTYQNLAYNLAATLKKVANSIEQKYKYGTVHQLKDDLKAFHDTVEDYAGANSDNPENTWMLMNMQHYAEKQIEKINVIEKAFMLNVNFKPLDKKRFRDLDKFIDPEYYRLQTLRENLGLSSTIFRHSLRLTVTIILGFIIGELLPLQNVYWILLTIIVIMRPGYGLTKTRSYHRIVGTLLGGLIAFALLSVVHHTLVIGTLAIVCMLLGYTFTAINYRVGATFVTMYVIFLYSMLTPDINQVIQYRILDTATGAILAFLGNYFFWPSWEFMNQPDFIKKSIAANITYLEEILEFYNKKGAVSTGYRLARKNAFVALGNLMSSYQRMTQEPKSKQKQLQQVYNLAVLNHTLLSSIASIGTYIQNHKTYEAPKVFNAVVDKILNNLQQAVILLELDVQAEKSARVNNEELALQLTELKNIKQAEFKELEARNESEFRLKMEEVHLINEQLTWLNNLSEKIVKSVGKLKLG